MNDYAAALLARCRDVVAVVDGDGVLTYASAGAEPMLGYELNDLVGRNAFDLVHPDDQIDAYEGFVSTSTSPDSRPTPLLLRLRRVDGTWLDVEVIATNHIEDPIIAGLLLTIRDVSSSMRTDASLRESEERYRLIVELAHEGIWMVDNRGIITYANRSLARMLRTTVTELVGSSIFAFIENEKRERVVTFAERGIATNDAYDFRLLTADKTPLWVRVSANPLQLHDGSDNGFIAYVTDITERRALEERLEHDARDEPPALPERASDPMHSSNIGPAGSLPNGISERTDPLLGGRVEQETSSQRFPAISRRLRPARFALYSA